MMNLGHHLFKLNISNFFFLSTQNFNMEIYLGKKKGSRGKKKEEEKRIEI